MTTYRTGTHHGVTICAENDGVTCDRDGHDCARGHMVAVVTNGSVALAERICALLNEGPIADDAIGLLTYALHLRQYGERAPGGNETWTVFDRRCEEFLRRHGGMLAPSAGRIQPWGAENGFGVPQPTPGDHGGPEGRMEIVHLIRDGSATTACCYRAPFELAARDHHRLTVEPDAVTCGIVPREGREDW